MKSHLFKTFLTAIAGSIVLLLGLLAVNFVKPATPVAYASGHMKSDTATDGTTTITLTVEESSYWDDDMSPFTYTIDVSNAITGSQVHVWYSTMNDMLPEHAVTENDQSFTDVLEVGRTGPVSFTATLSETGMVKPLTVTVVGRSRADLTLSSDFTSTAMLYVGQPFEVEATVDPAIEMDNEEDGLWDAMYPPVVEFWNMYPGEPVASTTISGTDMVSETLWYSSTGMYTASAELYTNQENPYYGDTGFSNREYYHVKVMTPELTLEIQDPPADNTYENLDGGTGPMVLEAQIVDEDGNAVTTIGTTSIVKFYYDEGDGEENLVVEEQVEGFNSNHRPLYEGQDTVTATVYLTNTGDMTMPYTLYAKLDTWKDGTIESMSNDVGIEVAPPAFCPDMVSLAVGPASPINIDESYTFTATIQTAEGQTVEREGVTVMYTKEGVGSFGPITEPDTDENGQALGTTLTSGETGMVTVTASVMDCPNTTTDSVELAFEQGATRVPAGEETEVQSSDGNSSVRFPAGWAIEGYEGDILVLITDVTEAPAGVSPAMPASANAIYGYIMIQIFADDNGQPGQEIGSRSFNLGIMITTFLNVAALQQDVPPTDAHLTKLAGYDGQWVTYPSTTDVAGTQVTVSATTNSPAETIGKITAADRLYLPMIMQDQS